MTDRDNGAQGRPRSADTAESRLGVASWRYSSHTAGDGSFGTADR
ncbi:hypothetical protein ABZY83_00855 [Streptomyces virginiae]|nr:MULTISPECIES: hypothetical protein [unclassified Streptomyces]